MQSPNVTSSMMPTETLQPPPSRKISAVSIQLRKLSDVLSPERRGSLGVNPFYKPLEDENSLTEEKFEVEDDANQHYYAQTNDERAVDYDGGDSMDGDVIDDETIEARKQCCGEARLNCMRFTSEMKKQGSEIKSNVRKIDAKACCKSILSMDTLKRRLPILQWAPKYRMAEFQGDLIAGVTVGLTVIPQSIAYAFMAGLPSQYGLYTAFIGSIVYIFFGSAKDITLGPSAVSSLLVYFFATSPIKFDPIPSIILAFFVGLIQIGMFFINFGYIMNFVSFSVLKSFAVASAITIAASQVKKWFGLKGIPKEFIPQLVQTVQNIPKTRLYDFLLGVVSIIIIVFLKKLKEYPWKTKYEDLNVRWKIVNKLVWFSGLCRNLVVIILGTIVAYLFEASGVRPFSITGYLPAGIPPMKIPQFYTYDPVKNVTYDLTYISSNVIGAGYIIVPILGLFEAMAIGNVFARKSNYRIDPNQELLAYGIGNVLTGLLSGYPITGTFSRTAINAQCGVKTQAGGLWTGIIVLLTLQFLTPVLYYIPDAALAVVIFMAVIDMVTFQKIWIFWNTNKIDVLPWLITFILSLVISIAYGVLIGVGVSILLLLWPTTKPKIRSIRQTVKDDDERGGGDIVLVTFNTGLMYPAIENMKDVLIPIYSTDETALPKGVILDFQHVAYIDTTTVQGLKVMFENFNKKNIKVVICNLQKGVGRILVRANPRFMLLANTIVEAELLILNGPQTAIDINGNIDKLKNENYSGPQMRLETMKADTKGEPNQGFRDNEPSQIRELNGDVIFSNNDVTVHRH